MEGPGINQEDSPLFRRNVLRVLHELFWFLWKILFNSEGWTVELVVTLQTFFPPAGRVKTTAKTCCPEFSWHVLGLSQTPKLSGGFKTWSETKNIFVSAFYCRNLNLWFLKVFLSLRFKSCVWRCSSLFFLSHMNNWLLLTRLWPFISSSSVTRFYIWSRVFCREIGFHLCLSVSASRRKL